MTPIAAAEFGTNAVMSKLESPGNDRLNSNLRFPELDGMRGVAIACVLVFHTFRPYTFPVVGRVLEHMVQPLWIGVDIFFALSGFLITRILLGLKDSPRRFTAFYGRRTLRIFPLYFFALTLILWLLPLLPVTEFSQFTQLRPMWPWYYAYAFNIWVFLYNGWPSFTALGYFWSLAVEEQFYLIWPFAVFFLDRRKLPAVAIAFCVIAFVCKLAMFFSGYTYPPIQTALFTRMDSLLLGGMAAYAYIFLEDHRAQPIARKLLILSGIWIAIMAVICRGINVGNTKYLTFATPAQAIFFASSLYLVLLAPRDFLPKRILCNRALRFLGKYSYGLYVYHSIVFLVVSEHVERHGWIHSSTLREMTLFVVANTLTVAIALLSFHAFEAHFLKFRPGHVKVPPIARQLDTIPDP